MLVIHFSRLDYLFSPVPASIVCVFRLCSGGDALKPGQGFQLGPRSWLGLHLCGFKSRAAHSRRRSTEPNKHATIANEADPYPIPPKKRKPRGRDADILDFTARLLFCLESVSMCMRASGHTVYQITPLSHTYGHWKGPPYPPRCSDLLSLSYLFFDPQVTYPFTLQAALNGPSTTHFSHLTPYHSPESPVLPLSAERPYLRNGPGGPLDTLCIADSSVPQHTHTRSSSPQSFALLQTLSVFWLKRLGAGWERGRACVCGFRSVNVISILE